MTYPIQKYLTIILVIFFNLISNAQITFEKGYFINNNGQRIECLIKNVDWEINPIEFKYKLTQDSEQKTQNIKSTKEFGIYNFSKYIKANVGIDRSSEQIDKLDYKREPNFKEEELLLKILVEGKANLYGYSDGLISRYFYSLNTSEIEPLVYKNYLSNQKELRYNIRYKQQILNHLKCNDITQSKIERAEYTKKDLTKIFMEYNKCMNPEYKNLVETTKKNLFNLKLRLGVNSNSLKTYYFNSHGLDVDFGNELGFRIGFEGEFILPFNKNKWGIIAEPYYFSFKSEKELGIGTRSAKLDYKSIELAIGLRHYFFLNQKSKLFINASFVTDLSNSSTIQYSYGRVIDDISNISGLALGAGYNYKKYHLELRYHTPRDIFRNHHHRDSDLNTIALIFGYTIF
ncbi:tRNA modification GTPase [uncultured Algibacter sp.]|uniref:tRNA modification GTPase n=1 Tax=uncultured Algibacter sp. TaxID=298659 RepID=UPI0026094671|nr:tRNA modification GTPase [uncultured Algibacter sp.]